MPLTIVYKSLECRCQHSTTFVFIALQGRQRDDQFPRQTFQLMFIPPFLHPHKTKIVVIGNMEGEKRGTLYLDSL